MFNFLTKSADLRQCHTIDDSKRVTVNNNETVVDLNFRETGQSPEKPLIYRKRVERRPTGESDGQEGY